jgi:hypothetical protein
MTPMNTFYTLEQQNIIFWVPKFFAVLSLVYSGIIIYLHIRDHKIRLARVYGRMWLGKATGTFGITLLMVLGTLIAPKGEYYASFGNEGTCQAFGFLFQLFFVGGMTYNQGILGISPK